MKKKKVYAVKKGHKTGLFDNWPECKIAIDGYPGAVFKSFASVVEAEEYMAASEPSSSAKSSLPVDAEIYVDGSWNDKHQQYGWGYVAVVDNSLRYKKYGSGANPDYVGSRQVGGEVVAVLQGIDYAIYKGYKHVKFFYDYTGIEAWANGTWTAKSSIANAYVYLLNEKKKKIKVSFRKVKAHSNNEFNDLADRLAKRGASMQKK